MPKTNKPTFIDIEEGFEIKVSYEQKKFIIDIYNLEEELVVQTTGPNLEDTFRHALLAADPVIAAQFYTKNYMEYSEDHKLRKEN